MIAVSLLVFKYIYLIFFCWFHKNTERKKIGKNKLSDDISHLLPIENSFNPFQTGIHISLLKLKSETRIIINSIWSTYAYNDVRLRFAISISYTVLHIHSINYIYIASIMRNYFYSFPYSFLMVRRVGDDDYLNQSCEATAMQPTWSQSIGFTVPPIRTNICFSSHQRIQFRFFQKTIFLYCISFVIWWQ